MQTKATDHICSRHAVCFHCFRKGVERTRARRDAWAQRTLPFEPASAILGARELAHRRRMLDHLSRSARRA